MGGPERRNRAHPHRARKRADVAARVAGPSAGNDSAFGTAASAASSYRGLTGADCLAGRRANRCVDSTTATPGQAATTATAKADEAATKVVVMKFLSKIRSSAADKRALVVLLLLSFSLAASAQLYQEP